MCGSAQGCLGSSEIVEASTGVLVTAASQVAHLQERLLGEGCPYYSF
jgi:hypothetical protein